MSGITEGPSAATRVVGVMGDPISHSMSPLIHNTAFEALGLDWVCVGFPTVGGRAVEAVRGVSALGIAGMSVTMPHKQAVMAALDDLSDDARALDAVNCIQTEGGRLIGHNTDGPGLVASLDHDFGVEPAGLDCVVIGAGGAARSVVLSLGRAGAASVTILNRSEPAAYTAAELTNVGRVGTVEDIARADLVINATPLGMVDTDTSADPDGARSVDPRGMPCDPDLLGPDHLVVDLIYQPLRTDWLEAAARRGARTANGTSMLVHQAAVAFELWSGMDAPVAEMSAAVAREISNRS